jgi:hypothetical protein
MMAYGAYAPSAGFGIFRITSSIYGCFALQTALREPRNNAIRDG